jgi:hypothetical protein
MTGQSCAASKACATPNFCNETGAMCTPIPQAGQPCQRDLDFHRYTCDAAGICDEFATAGPTCVARTLLGGTCATTTGLPEQSSCATDLLCVCNDAACTAARCMAQARDGEACGAPNTFCVPGTECRAGRCVGVDSQGLMAQNCGP